MPQSGELPDEPAGDGAELPEEEQAAHDPNAPDAEMAHVLFLDMVGYSQVPTDVQGTLIDRLQKVVKDSKEFRRAHARQELIALPTGDGMALVFMQDPAAPVRCALEIAASLKEHPEIPVRMGVNSGPIFRRTDITGNVNVSGAGIDYAQRAMDRGDAGHILLTKATAGYLSYLGAWAADLHYLGEFQVKHRQKIQLYNLYRGNLGNPKHPARRVPVPGIPIVPATVRRWTPPRKVGLVAAAVFVIAIVAWLWPSSPPQPLKPSLNLLTNRAGQEVFPSLSNDGSSLIYASKIGGRWQLCRQRLAAGFAVPTVEKLMPDSADDDTQPALSPGRKIHRLPVRARRGRHLQTGSRR